MALGLCLTDKRRVKFKVVYLLRTFIARLGLLIVVLLFKRQERMLTLC